MKANKIPFLVIAYFFISDVFGQPFKRNQVSSSERVYEESNECNEDIEAEGKLLTILGEQYPISKISITAENIYENHTRSELIDLLAECICLSSLLNEDDSKEEAYRKYIATILSTAIFFAEYAPTLGTIVSWLNQDYGLEFIRTYKNSDAYNAQKVAENDLFWNVLIDSFKSSRYFYSFRGRFFQIRFSELATNYLDSKNIDLTDNKYLFDASEKYLLSLTIKELYSYWQKVNKIVLDRLPQKVSGNFISLWSETHKRYVLKMRPSDNSLWNPIVKELSRYEKYFIEKQTNVD